MAFFGVLDVVLIYYSANPESESIRQEKEKKRKEIKTTRQSRRQTNQGREEKIGATYGMHAWDLCVCVC